MDKCVEYLDVVDEEEKAYRDGAKEHGEVFKDKALHDRYMDKCVEYLENHVHMHEVDFNAGLEAFPNSEKVKVVVEIFDLLEVHS
ncbi:unnamed protein product [Prunus armeniaca]|uniref:Uncharacterized protein n=2 Tax=Prunus armeniaca TaxID=36596 RepID=A0A6J5V959_PRUAR|nr:unnamed protein product [Prunus armeniaca]